MENNIEEYDSTKDTIEHIKLVDTYLRFLAHQLLIRGQEHDRSKLSSPEKEILDRVVPELKNLTYGTEEYEVAARKLDEYKVYHRKVNRHHAGHFENGVYDMNIVDLIEMFADWCSASKTHNVDSNIYRSIDIMQTKLGFGNVLVQIMKNTVHDFNLGKVEE